MSAFIGFNSQRAFAKKVVSEITDLIENENKTSKIFRIALSGGSTPVPIYEELSKTDRIDWKTVECYLVDERYVDVTDSHSNLRMIQQSLFSSLKNAPKKVVSFDPSLPIDAALARYEQQLGTKKSPFFDLILLGIGEDGHIASLFPGSPAVQEESRWVAHTTTDQFPVHDRLTLTFPALVSSRHIFFLVRGAKKMAILKKLRSRNPSFEDFPASRLISLPQTSVYFCEE